MTKIEGLNGISATLIQASSGPDERTPVIYTMELEYPRFIHSELMTHRVFSRNAASSRAIPVEKMQEDVLSNPAIPVHWGKNQSGMQAKQELEGQELLEAKELWREARLQAVAASKALYAAGLHKQIANRVTEPFQMMKTIVTSTEWDNWFELRNHEDAQPEIRELARVMLEAWDSCTLDYISEGDWHVPYVTRKIVRGSVIEYLVGGEVVTVEQALAISASCCAQVSYRKNDDSLEKALTIFDRLINSRPMHASPIEHQAKALRSALVDRDKLWPKGITHIDHGWRAYSGNFRGWIQHRQLVD